MPVWPGPAPKPWLGRKPVGLAGLAWRVPDFSTLCRRQKTLRVQLPYQSSATALDLLVDSTGIKFLGEGEWKRKKHGAEYRRQWRKVHLGIDAHTLEIRAIEVTDNSVGDAPMLPELLGQIPADEAVASVSGDGAYDTKACHAAIAQRGAQAVIPPRKNARPWRTTLVGATSRNAALSACHRQKPFQWRAAPSAQPSPEEDWTAEGVLAKQQQNAASTGLGGNVPAGRKCRILIVQHRNTLAWLSRAKPCDCAHRRFPGVCAQCQSNSQSSL